MNPKNTIILLCDDIRQEINNKVSLMGLYNPDIIFSELPIVLSRLSIAVLFEDVPEDLKAVYIKITIPANEELAKDLYLPLPPLSKDIKNANLAINILNVKIKEEGEGMVELRSSKEGAPFKTQKFRIIRKKQTSNPNQKRQDQVKK